MKTLKFTLSTLLLLILASESFARGDGTWPLRLRGGDGTWPLRFNGEAISLANPDALAIETGLTIADLVEDPASEDTPITFECSEGGDAHLAQGTVKVGESAFAIVGICYFEETDSIQIVSELEIRGDEGVVIATSLMSGKVPEEEDAADQFQGRIRVGQNAAESGRYKFAINKIERLGPVRD